jgi:hypothetical protein
MARLVLAGYLVRCPLGGYAWQAAHFLLGLRRLGHDVWFYEDTGHYASAYNPATDELVEQYDYGLAAAAAFFERLGCGDRWVFKDVQRGREYGPGAGRAAALVREADLLLNLAGVNYFPLEHRNGRPALYVDLDPAYTQLKLATGDAALQAILEEHQLIATFGENIGTSRSLIPTGGFVWHPIRQPVIGDFWKNGGPPRPAYTTVGHWDSRGRELVYQGRILHWQKRLEWLKCLDLPALTGQKFEMAMDVWRVPGDLERLAKHGWSVIDPRSISADFWKYQEYLRNSRGEFTVAKEMNVELRSGWFSDRAVCYLAAGRPVVAQDTGFGEVLPLGPGLHAFRTVEEASEAIRVIESDYQRASDHATAVAHEYFEAERVLRELLQPLGL